MSELQDRVESAQRIMGFEEADLELLRSVAPTTKAWAPELAKAFYDTVYGDGETATLMEGQQREERERVLIEWFEHIVGCDHRSTLWKETWIVGLLHIVVGVENHLMLGLVTRLQQHFARRCRETFEAKQASAVGEAFQRLLALVAIVIADGYVYGLLEGMKSVGLNDQLMRRMRKVEVGRAIARLREEVAAKNAA